MKTRRWLSEYEHSREQGITILSILMAIGMAVSTLVLALTGRGGSVPAPAPRPPDKGGVKEWVKKSTYWPLGVPRPIWPWKAVAALPGIIGSIVFWLLSTLGKAASWFADNLWALVIGMGTLLRVAARDCLARPRDQPKRH